MDTKKIIGGAVAIAALAAAAYYGTTMAKAADLGGNCCADLEERIAEMEATTARKGNRKVSVTISGQVNRALLWIDDAHGMIDNFNSPSRLTFSGAAKFNPQWSAGFLIELAVGSAGDAAIASNGIATFVNPFVGGGLGELTVRHNAVWIGTPLGKVWLGHTSTATDGIVEVNLANVNVVALPTASWLGFDGSRTQVLKWESPTLAGFTLSASVSDSLATTTTPFDAALRYAGEFSGFRFAAGVGYADNDGGTTRLSGSASVMHVPTGLFVTGQAGRIDGGAHVIGGTAGIERNFFGIGATTVFGEYAKADDVAATIGALGIPFAVPLVEATVVGFGIVQAVDALGTDVYASYRNVDLGFGDADVFMAGMRVKF